MGTRAEVEGSRLASDERANELHQKVLDAVRLADVTALRDAVEEGIEFIHGAKGSIWYKNETHWLYATLKSQHPDTYGLSEEQRDLMVRALYEIGMSQQMLRIIFKISPTAVSDIIEDIKKVGVTLGLDGREYQRDSPTAGGRPKGGKDLTGRVIGMLTVVCETEPHVTPSGSVHRKWECLCQCGNTKAILATNLNGWTGSMSCGCMQGKVQRKWTQQVDYSVPTSLTSGKRGKIVSR